MQGSYPTGLMKVSVSTQKMMKEGKNRKEKELRADV